MNNTSINALIARLFVYGLVALADEVKNATTVEITDLSHFNVLDENGYGNQYVVEGNDETTVVYGKLLEPDGGTVWQFREQPDYEVTVPENACEENIAVVEAILNIKDIMPEYWEKTLFQRIWNGTGSVFSTIYNTVDMEQALINANWERAENTNVAPGCTAYVTKDIPGGQYGMVPVATQPDGTIFVIEDQKNTGKVSLVMQGAGRIPAEETWLIVGPADNGEPVVFTFHPGEPVPRATTSTEELPVGTKLTKKEALALGFNLAKVG